MMPLFSVWISNEFLIFYIFFKFPQKRGFPPSQLLGARARAAYATGIDLSKIFKGQTQILGGNVVKTDKCMGVPDLGGRAPGLPPQSTPMIPTSIYMKNVFHQILGLGLWLMSLLCSAHHIFTTWLDKNFFINPASS